jgi:hypothetical protein
MFFSFVTDRGSAGIRLIGFFADKRAFVIKLYQFVLVRR